MAEIGIAIDVAKEKLLEGKAIGIPTETVYGLAANGLDPIAVAKIFEIKGRPHFDPLILHVASIEQAQKLVTHFPDEAKMLFATFSPGPITLLLPKNNVVPDIVTSGLPRVAIRIPNHMLTLELLKNIDFPLAAPSANPFGYISPTTAQHVNNQLGDKIEYILDGGSCIVGVESTIVGFENEQVIIYRAGGVSKEAIEETLGREVEVRIGSSAPEAPGMLLSHYAPGKPLILGSIKENLLHFYNKKVAVLSFGKVYDSAYIQLDLSPTKNMNEAAANLFGMLRALDDSDCDMIVAELLPAYGIGLAINDRLTRAAGKRS